MLKLGMALKKAYCTRCHGKDPKEHIFEANSDAEVCYCPRCMNKLRPNDAIDAYGIFIKKLLRQADRTFFSSIGYNKSYSLYARVLDFEPSNIDALLGRLLSLTYMSALRKTQFENVVSLLNNDKELFRKSANLKAYFTFLNRACRALDEYYANIRKKLIVRQHFHDVDCIKIYFKKLNEIHNFQAFLMKEYRFIQAHGEILEVSDSIGVLIKRMEITREDPNQKWTTADWHTYSYAGISNTGDLILGRSDKSRPQKTPHHRPKTLLKEKTNLKVRLVSDQVFPNYYWIFILLLASLPASGVLFISALITLIFALVNSNGDLIFVTVLLFVGFVAFLGAFLFSFFQMKRRYRLMS